MASTRCRTRHEIVADMNDELYNKLPGIEWAFSQYIRDNVMEAISGVKGDNCVKIYGPDLDKLEELAEKTKNELAQDPRPARPGHLPHHGPVEPRVRGRQGQVQALGRAGGRRQQRHQHGRPRQRP